MSVCDCLIVFILHQVSLPLVNVDSLNPRNLCESPSSSEPFNSVQTSTSSDFPPARDLVEFHNRIKSRAKKQQLHSDGLPVSYDRDYSGTCPGSPIVGSCHRSNISVPPDPIEPNGRQSMGLEPLPLIELVRCIHILNAFNG